MVKDAIDDGVRPCLGLGGFLAVKMATMSM
jgi:hypothetical protein